MFVTQHSGDCHIVFDGYEGSPSIKDEKARMKQVQASVDVSDDRSINIFVFQQAFLSNTKNETKNLLLCCNTTIRQLDIKFIKLMEIQIQLLFQKTEFSTTGPTFWYFWLHMLQQKTVC